MVLFMTNKPATAYVCITAACRLHFASMYATLPVLVRDDVLQSPNDLASKTSFSRRQKSTISRFTDHEHYTHMDPSNLPKCQ